MALEGEIGALLDGRQQLRGEADIDLDHTVALVARHVVMVVAAGATHAITMRTIGKRHSVQYPLRDEHIHRTKDCRTTKLRIHLQQLLPEVVGDEICSPCGKLRESLCDQTARTSVTKPCRFKCGEDGVCRDRHWREYPFLLPRSL